MKNFYCCLALLGVLLSCTTDETFVATTAQPVPDVWGFNSYRTRTTDTLPANEANPYDLAGALHLMLLSDYAATLEKPSDLAALQLLIAAIANDHPDYQSVAPAVPVPISSLWLSELAAGEYLFLSDVLMAPTMSPLGKKQLDHFAHALLEQYEAEAAYPVLHTSIVLYESEVLRDSTLTAADKRILLTTSSIARFSAYAARKRPKKNTDPDWDLLIANLAGAGEGASHDTGTAAVMALTAGIAANEGILE